MASKEEIITEFEAMKSNFDKDFKTIKERMVNINEFKKYIMPQIKIELNTGAGQVSFTTNTLKGTLHSVIIDSPNDVEVLIESKIGYTILKRKVSGIEYVAPRTRITPSDDNAADRLTFDKFMLNEKLNITIMGMKNTDVSLIFRLD